MTFCSLQYDLHFTGISMATKSARLRAAGQSAAEKKTKRARIDVLCREQLSLKTSQARIFSACCFQLG